MKRPRSTDSIEEESHDHDDGDSSSVSSSSAVGDNIIKNTSNDDNEHQLQDDTGNGNEDDNDMTTKQKQKKKKKVRKLKLSTTEDFNAKLQKRGILYLSRVPPRMGPAKVKTLLSDFGPITRIYLVEEDKTIRKKRRKMGGSSGKRYTEGWIEFESKKVAKLVAETINMSRITNHKGSIHYDDIWNVKYLKGFKWSHLTEKVAYERRVREQKLRVEMMEVKRENAAYVAQVEKGKRLDYIDERRKKRGDDKDEDDKDHNNASKKRKIRQKKAFEGSSSKSALLGSLV